MAQHVSNVCAQGKGDSLLGQALNFFPDAVWEGRHQSLAMTVTYDMVNEYITSHTLLVVSDLGPRGRLITSSIAPELTLVFLCAHMYPCQ